MNLLEKFHNEEKRDQIIIWYHQFQKADKIKRLTLYDYNYTKVDAEKNDKRMKRVWEILKKYEVLPTFENGELTSEASSLLRITKLYLTFYKRK